MTPERVRREIVARFNPIRGLTPDLLSKRLDSFRVGYLRELAITYDAIEERNITIKTVASKRKKAASRLQWDIVRVDGADETEAERHEAGLRYFYENLKATSVMEQNQRGGVALLVRQMMDAVGKRYACHEIVWKPVAKALKIPSKEKGTTALGNAGGPQDRLKPALQTGTPSNGNSNTRSVGSDGSVAPGSQPAESPNTETQDQLAALITGEFRFCPLWFFENRTGRLRFIPTAFGVDGVEMPDGGWLVTVGDGIMEACSVAHMFQGMSLKDWVSFSEKFGMPGVIGKTDAQKDSEQWQAMADAVAALMADWAAVMNKNDAIELLETKGGAANLPFPPLVEYMDRKIAAIWRGADLSTISHAGAGEGTGASLQGEESDLLLEDDAQLITETLNQQVDTFVIEYLFGPGTEPLAYFKLGTGREEADDAKFRREVFMKFLTDGTINDVMANLTDLRELTKGVGLPPNEEYIEPYLPVNDAQGNPISGDVRRDPEGDIVGGASARPQGDSGNDGRNGNNGRNPALANDAAAVAAMSERLQENAYPEFARAVAHDLRPVVERLARILDIADPEIQRTKLAAFLQELPQLRRDVTADARAAQVLEGTIASALLNGFSQKGPEAALVK